MSVEQAYWAMIGLGALCALGLASCCMLVSWLLPRPKRFGFDIKDDHSRSPLRNGKRKS
ncbi:MULTISPECIES: hypothetical protein [unclassified Mesorhizobium]|uniref:hypothetical protein n=1 Tax=unclassified Mesorhizobium TaxID=325217 RepID=UPI0013E32F3A|nr:MULTISPECIES: hypothetical protein [unclassified Mesorhizobium]